MRVLLVVLGAITFLTGPYIFFAPYAFYEVVPGLSMMGPFSMHFVRDVGLAFTASGACITYGAYRNAKEVAIAGALWPFLHGLFHVQIWFKLGLPFDHIAAFDFSAVILPSLLMMVLAARLERVTLK